MMGRPLREALTLALLLGTASPLRAAPATSGRAPAAVVDAGEAPDVSGAEQPDLSTEDLEVIQELELLQSLEESTDLEVLELMSST